MLYLPLPDLSRQRTTLGKALEAQQMAITLDPQEYFEVFGDADPRQHGEGAEQRWGGSEEYAESVRRASRYDREDRLPGLAAYVHAAIHANALSH